MERIRGVSSTQLVSLLKCPIILESVSIAKARPPLQVSGDRKDKSRDFFHFVGNMSEVLVFGTGSFKQYKVIY